MNYQEIVNRIQDITNQHKMLADFGYGDLSDLKVRFENTSGDASVQADYPYLFLNPGVHGRNGGVVTYNFNMIVMDMARGEVSDQPYNNMLAIQSQCQQYIDDVIAYLHDGFKDNPDVIYTGVTYTPFNERFQDEVSGMTATLTIEVPQPINNCITPFEPVPAQVIYNTEYTGGYNGSFTTIAPSVNNGGPFLFNETTSIDGAYLTSSANMTITPLVDTPVQIEFVMTSKNKINQTLIDAQPAPFFNDPTPAMRLFSGNNISGFTFHQEDAWDFNTVVGDEFVVTNTFQITLLAGVEYGYGFSANPSNGTVGGDPYYNQLIDWSNVKYTITLA